MSDAAYEVFRAHRESQTRYTYFLLAAAGGGIALAVNQTMNHEIAWSHAPLALAVACWGLSFYFGCRQNAYVVSHLYSNGELLRVETGRHPLAGSHPEAIAIGSQAIRKAMERDSERANVRGTFQFRFLVGGAVLFLAWHVLQMYLHRYPIPWLG